MSFKFQILATSSGGNCSVLVTPSCAILIDAGLSKKEIATQLNELGMGLEDIDAIFFTHEHRDHAIGVPGITSSGNTPKMFANQATARAISEKFDGHKRIKWTIFEPGKTFEFCDLKVTPFSIPHDSEDACGYVFEHDNEKLAWLTDCGKITNVIRQKLADCDFLVIESNHDLELLNRSGRTEQLKARIRGGHGHLSNAQCEEFLREYDNPKLKIVFFAHISAECNTPELIKKTSYAAAREKGVRAEIIGPKDRVPENGGFGF